MGRQEDAASLETRRTGGMSGSNANRAPAGDRSLRQDTVNSSPLLQGAIPPEVRAVIEHVPFLSGADDLSVAPLEAGPSLNNALYQVRAGGEEYVLRVAAETGRLLGVSRIAEKEAIRTVARAGLHPELLYFSPEGHMVTRLIGGRHWLPDDFANEVNIDRLASALRRLHSLDAGKAEGSVYRRVEQMLKSARTLGLELPPDLPLILDRIHRLETRRRADERFPRGLCHNDLWANNFLDDGENLWLLDWEFGGAGDGLYDLTTASMAGQFTDEQRVRLLQAYGYEAPGDLELLHGMTALVYLFEGIWGMIQHGITGSDGFNYQEYARNLIQKLRDDTPF